MRFGTKLAFFLAFTLIAVQALTMAVGYAVTRGQLIDRGRDELAKAAEVFDRQLDLVAQRMSKGVEILALDYPLRQAIAHQDLPTIVSALQNHGERVGAARMYVVDLDGLVIADTKPLAAQHRKFPFPTLLETASTEGSASGKALLDGNLGWFVAVPVQAPVTIAYVVAELRIDDALASELRGLSALSTSVLIQSQDGHLLAGSYVADDDQTNTLASSVPLATIKGSAPVTLVFHFPMSAALGSYNALLKPLLAVFLIGLSAALAGAIAIARRVSRPIEALAQSAQRIQGGDYTRPPSVPGSDELARLSQALSAMAGAIGERSDELKHSRDEALRANAAKSEFLANMSHEIRTPLNAVLGLAGVLLDTPMNEEQRAHVALIKQSGDNLSGLLNDILDLSKLDAGQMELESFPFDPQQVTQSCLDLLRQRAEQKGLALTLEVEGVPDVLIGDPSRIRQILINLIGNAIKFTNEGNVAVRVAATGAASGAASIEWSVQDSGIGISADRIDRLFKDFVQADASIARRYGGTGLGLAICKRLVDRMGGTIGATSVEGVGTTIAFKVPMKIGSRAQLAPKPQGRDVDLAEFVRAFGRTIRILVAEDNVTNQVVARSILNVPGLHIDLAGNGREAVDAVKRHPYDLVFMDVQMPDVDGLTATREIRALGGRLAGIPIIAFTANAFASDIDACLKAGMNGHVAKPVQKEALRAALTDALCGKFSAVAGPEKPALSERDAKPFDKAIVDDLVEVLTETVVTDLLTSFVRDTRARIDRLPTLLSEYKRLTIEVHAIKSSGAQVGAMRLSRVAAALEQRALRRETLEPADFRPLREALEGFGQGLAARAAR